MTLVLLYGAFARVDGVKTPALATGKEIKRRSLSPTQHFN
jgi:hypothetical protein